MTNTSSTVTGSRSSMKAVGLLDWSALVYQVLPWYISLLEVLNCLQERKHSYSIEKNISLSSCHPVKLKVRSPHHLYK